MSLLKERLIGVTLEVAALLFHELLQISRDCRHRWRTFPESSGWAEENILLMAGVRGHHGGSQVGEPRQATHIGTASNLNLQEVGKVAGERTLPYEG